MIFDGVWVRPSDKDKGQVVGSTNTLAKCLANTTNRMLRFIHRQSREFSEPHCLVALYKSLVRSILEYSSVVWCPSSSLWSNKIESVQKKFTRLVLRFTPWRNVAARPSYHARCLIFGLESLATRRETAQILFMKKSS